MKWGEYANDIQFILRRSDTNGQKPAQAPARPAVGNGYVVLGWLLIIIMHKNWNNT